MAKEKFIKFTAEPREIQAIRREMDEKTWEDFKQAFVTLPIKQRMIMALIVSSLEDISSWRNGYVFKLDELCEISGIEPENAMKELQALSNEVFAVKNDGNDFAFRWITSMSVDWNYRTVRLGLNMTMWQYYFWLRCKLNTEKLYWLQSWIEDDDNVLHMNFPEELTEPD